MTASAARRARRAAQQGRGGHREGTPGKSYSNRSDLNQPVRVAPSRTYGDATQQAQAQQAVPLPAAPAVPGGGSGSQQPAQPPGPPPVMPGSLGALNAPSQRPNEPLTAGLATGPGPGPEALGFNQAPLEDPVVHVLQGILSRYPNSDVEALLAQARSR